MTIPIAVTIAGSDSSGGAGIQADLKTFSARGAYGASVITALTAQNTTGVQAVLPIPPGFVASQIDSVFSDLRVDVVKIGMLATPEVIRTVAAGLERWNAGLVVLDPVMVAQSGDPLVADEAVAVLRDELMPRAALITPNLPEAARLLGARLARSTDEAEAQGRALIAAGARAVLVKGGHGGGADSVDVLVTPAGSRAFSAPRIDTPHTHGTGCSLGSAIAVDLARGIDLPDAVERSKAWLTEAIRAAAALRVGRGAGPVHHFHGLWDRDGGGP